MAAVVEESRIWPCDAPVAVEERVAGGFGAGNAVRRVGAGEFAGCCECGKGREEECVELHCGDYWRSCVVVRSG